MYYHDIKDIGKFLRELILKELDSGEYKVFLFGSRATKTHSPQSDWDIGILGKESLPFKKLLHLRQITEALPWKVDIIDLSRADDAFRNFALSQAQPWN
jgi:predicted nucleotidyltransferase